MSSTYVKSIKSVQEMSRRFLGHVHNPAQVPSGRKCLKMNKFNYSAYPMHTRGARPFDATGLFLTKVQQDRIENTFEMRATGRGPPKKGQGKQAQLAAGKKKK